MKRTLIVLVALLLVVPLSAQQTDRQKLEETLGQLQAIVNGLVSYLAPPPPPTHQTVQVPCGQSLQTAINDARAANIDTTLELVQDCTYAGSVSVPSSPHNRILTITTAGLPADVTGWEGMARPSDIFARAIVVGSLGTNSAIEIPTGSNNVNLLGLELRCAHVACDIIRIGDRVNAQAALMPTNIEIRRNLILGSLTYGTRRGIKADGRDILIEQNWCDEIWQAGTDSQCVAADNGGQNVTIRFNYLAAGSENIMLGGAPTLGAEMHPRDWVITDNILHKPLRWQTDGQNRQVKNLIEFKYGSDILVERVLMVNSWVAAQDGKAIVVHFTTNGACSWCGNLEDVVFRDVVALNAAIGISFQGHTNVSTAGTTSHLERALVEHAYFSLVGTSRPIYIGNVLGRHDVTLRRVTVKHTGTKWLEAAYGQAWSGEPPALGPGGPMQGLWVVDNVISRNGRYGVTADPSGGHYGTTFGTYVSADRQIAGNVFGDAGPTSPTISTQIANYNLHTAGGASNISVPQAQMDAALPASGCGTWAPDKGADCTRLAPIFALLSLLPEA